MLLYTFSKWKPLQHCPHPEPHPQLGFSTMLLVNLPSSLQKLQHRHVWNWYIYYKKKMHLNAISHLSFDCFHFASACISTDLNLLWGEDEDAFSAKSSYPVHIKTHRKHSWSRLFRKHCRKRLMCVHTERISQVWTIKDKTALFFMVGRFLFVTARGRIFRK